MAKHKIDGKGFVSKGQRVSCYGNVKHAPRAVGGDMDNAMRSAFRNAKLDTNNFNIRGLVVMCVDAITKPVRLTDDQKRGWSAKLSFKTYNELKAQEIMS